MELLGPDGKPVSKTTCVRFDGKLFPYRIVDQDVLKAKDPRIGLLGVLTQMGDQHNLMWLGLTCLAKDIYSRQPEGSREFQRLTEELGMVIVDGERNEIDVAKELK